MTFGEDLGAPIPNRATRDAVARYLPTAQAGGVGSWGWNPNPEASTVAGPTIVQVKNTGTNAIKRFEACRYLDSQTSTDFFSKVYDCGLAQPACRGGATCELGTCGTWPVYYEDVYNSAMDEEPYQFQVSSVSVAPKPGSMPDWLVAAEDISAGAVGYAYSAGIFYAFVWDPNDILDEAPELRFVDLHEDGQTYDTDDSSPTINLPLQVRANGRGRVLAYDRNVYVSDGTISEDPPWPMDKVRLALIQRAPFFTYPTLPCSLTSATETSAGSNRYEYGWELKHDSGATEAMAQKAINLAEEGNTASTVNGLTTSSLDACFGAGDWEMQDSSQSGMDVMMTFAIDAAGDVQPYFCLPNQIIPA
tara:strand:+ start:1549 stop:2634 length:1086 start_codon:yes stop_codon:yes gene_type:complete